LIGVVISEDAEDGSTRHYREELKELMGIKNNHYPAIRFIQLRRDRRVTIGNGVAGKRDREYKVEKYLMSKKLDKTRENIKKFVDSVLSRKLKPYYLSQNPGKVKQNSRWVQEVVGKNFREKLSKFSEDFSFVLFNYEESENCIECNEVFLFCG
jgi:hypothetical protein